MLSAQDLRGVIGIMPTPSKAGADRADAVDTVDLDETARLTEQMIQDGVSGFMALGTMGECATLTQDEFEKFVDCFLSTVRKRVPTFVGTTALGTHEIVWRIRFVRELGADGTLLGIPMWQPATLEMAVQYYASISELFPDFAIMVYANSRAFRYDFGVPFWKQIAEKAPTVIASKFSNARILVEAVEATKGRVNFIPNAGQIYHFFELSPETTKACWLPAVGPEPALALMKAILAGDRERAKEIAEDLRWAGEPTHAITSSPEIFASYNIQLEKTWMEASGYSKPGPIRPPYNYMPEEYLEASREHARRWIKLREKYATVPAGR